MQLGRSYLDSYKRGCGDVLVSRKLELIASALDVTYPAPYPEP